MAATSSEILLPYQGHLVLVCIFLSTLGNALEPNEQRLLQRMVADSIPAAATQKSIRGWLDATGRLKPTAEEVLG